MATGWRLPYVFLDGGGGGFVPRGSRVEVFAEIFWVFLVLGTLVGVVVLAYMVYNAYRYRDGSPDASPPARPLDGDPSEEGGGGRKLLLSFTISTVIVVSLIVWTYSTLLYVEAAPATENEDALEVQVVGDQFSWQFIYPNGNTTKNVLRVPADRPVELHVTSDDVFHNFGIPGLRVKTDAIPGETTDAWFIAEEPGTHQAHCYELCGAGHSYMDATVRVMEPDEFDKWYANTTAAETNNATTTTTTTQHD